MLLASRLLSISFPTLHPAQALLAFAYATPANAALGLLDLPRVRQTQRLPPGLLTHMAVAIQALGPFAVRPSEDQPPQPARELVIPPPAHNPHSPCPLSPLLRSTCWLQRSAGTPSAGPTVVFALAEGPLRVADITDFLTRARHPARDAIHRIFVGDALGPTASASDRSAAATTLRATFSKVWQHPCDDSLKEPLWRLAAGAFTGARFRPWRCPCGFATLHPRPTPASSPSQHVFWDCPVLSTLRATLQVPLPALLRRHVWLLDLPPSAPLNADVWVVVCLSALAAMEAGRVALWADGRGQRLTPVVIRELACRVNLEFWALLSDYTNWAPPLAHDGLSPDHPFLRHRGGRLEVAPH